MENERQLLWIIPNDEYNDRNLKDGDTIFYPFTVGDRDHGTRTTEFCDEYGFVNYPIGGSHNDWGKYLTDRGLAVFFNSGMKIDDKYFGCWYLPSQLTAKQIEFLESQKELFYEQYNTHPSFFRSFVKPEGDMGYKSPNGFRDLKLEAQINNQTTENGVDIFYNEINSQKEKLNNQIK